MAKKCSIEGCLRLRLARGWCATHYQRWMVSGSPGEAELRRVPSDPKRTEKPCTKCREVKPMTEFYAEKRQRDGRQTTCKVCFQRAQKNLRLKRIYGIDDEQYQSLLKTQNGQCAICQSTHRIVLDHDHKTGKVRAFLCDDCNVILGRAKDDAKRLRAAADYLDRFH